MESAIINDFYGVYGEASIEMVTPQGKDSVVNVNGGSIGLRESRRDEFGN